MMQCQVCQRDVAGVIHYHVGGATTVEMCAGCYAQAWAKRHHPYASITQQIYRLVNLTNINRRVS